MHHQKLFGAGRRSRLLAILVAAGSKRQAADKLKDDEKRRRLRAEVVAVRGGEK